MKKIFLLMFFLFIFVSCDEEGLIDEEIQVVRDTIDTMYAVSETHSEENIRELKSLLPSAVEILNKYSVQELPEENREIFSLEELVKVFDYHHMSKSPAVFDYNKLKWMNGEYMKAMDSDRFYEMAEPYLKKAITKPLDLKKIAEMVKTRIEVFPDILPMVDFFQELPDYDTALYAHKKMKTTAESSLEVLEELLPRLEAQEDYSNDALYSVLTAYVAEKGCKNGYVMWPVRIAVSGKAMTPAGATEIMEVLGKEESLKRIRTAVEKLKA